MATFRLEALLPKPPPHRVSAILRKGLGRFPPMFRLAPTAISVYAAQIRRLAAFYPGPDRLTSELMRLRVNRDNNSPGEANDER